ncbi:hypothetical protein ON010_g9024 [Phytophthora cinnamomi]|nr:hypothetical protein ON010_g9024 [Phytophthora cinnamomi]
MCYSRVRRDEDPAPPRPSCSGCRYFTDNLAQPTKHRRPFWKIRALAPPSQQRQNVRRLPRRRRSRFSGDPIKVEWRGGESPKPVANGSFGPVGRSERAPIPVNSSKMRERVCGDSRSVNAARLQPTLAPSNPRCSDAQYSRSPYLSPPLLGADDDAAEKPARMLGLVTLQQKHEEQVEAAMRRAPQCTLDEVV